ncbi:hypothetical protein JZ751_015211 [Albula glossodonta]|uniref:Uncharacterized protein n=1 Tax=Albula glossodonta TaxID=121402 RepID=A0A8T2NS70_9TELE|nr:hypothetical protein JZ751_015211 [Albula glossodonta]
MMCVAKLNTDRLWSRITSWPWNLKYPWNFFLCSKRGNQSLSSAHIWSKGIVSKSNHCGRISVGDDGARGWTFPPKPFHFPAPNPLFFMPNNTRPGWTTKTSVSSLEVNIVLLGKQRLEQGCTTLSK